MKHLIAISILSLTSLFVRAQSDTIISFDGLNDLCRYEGDSMTGAFSVDFFFKDCALDTQARALFSLDGFEIALVGDSALASLVIKDFSSIPQPTFLSNYAPGAWNHMGVEYNPINNQLVVLLNGFSIISLTKAQFDWSGQLMLGSNPSRTSHFKGQIDNLRISDTLRLGFIATIPQAPFSYDSITVALWNFDNTFTQLALTSKGDSLFIEGGAHPLQIYSDIISQACENELLQFSFPMSGTGFFASPASNFQWNDPILLWTAVEGVQNYRLNFTDSNACVNTLLLQTEIFPSPEIAFGSDTVLCEGDSVLLQGEVNESNLWSDSSRADSFWVKTSGLYWLEITNTSGCTSRDSIRFTHLNSPAVELGKDTTLPRFGTLELDAGPGFASYFWSTFESGQKILATLPSWYWVEVTDSNGCRARDSIYILIEGVFPFGVEENQDADYFAVYPNPAKNTLHVLQKSSYTHSSWLIIGLDGQVLDFEESGASSIDISALAPGNYMLWLRRVDGKLLSYNFLKASP